MKRRYFLIVFALLSFSFVASAAKSDSTVIGDKKLGVHPWKEYKPLADGFAHWSITFEGGIDLIDGDFVQPRNTILPRSYARPTGGITVEYSFSPTWSLGLSYVYGNYGLKYKSWNDYTLMGHMHTGEAQISYDLIDAWFPKRKKDIFSLYAIVGLGIGFYNCEFIPYDGADPIHPRNKDKYDMTGVISVGAAAEVNLTRELALGLKGLYNIYTNDRIDAREKGSNNDCMEYLSLTLRWKVAGRKKNHIRNYSSESVLMAKWAETENNDNNATATKDTVVISRVDTLVVSHVDTIVVVTHDSEQKVTHTKVAQERVYTYFEHDKATLSEQSLNTLQQLATRMQEDSTIYIEVSGYCDNTGSEAYNEKLGQRRADAVSNELINVYGIDKDRFLPVSRGRINNVKSAYGPNRRVEILITTKEDLQTRRQKYEEEKQAKQNAKVQPNTDTVSEDQASEEGVDDSEFIAHVKSQKNLTTLSQLARKYYKNVYCWPYIYAANQDVLKSPDFIPEGLTIKIPRLTAEQTDPNNAESMKAARKLAQQYLMK